MADCVQNIMKWELNPKFSEIIVPKGIIHRMKIIIVYMYINAYTFITHTHTYIYIYIYIVSGPGSGARKFS